MVLLLTEQDVRSVLTMEMALESVEAAFRGLADGSAFNLPRRRVVMPRGLLHTMASAVGAQGVFGAKLYATFGSRTDFLVPLYDAQDGRMLALIEADWLGRVRTGAASGVATRCLARPEARSLGLFGAGGQAQTQLLAVCAVRPIERVHVYSRSSLSREAFVREMQPQVQAQLVAVDQPRAAVEGMDVITTITTAREPLFLGDWVAPGAHINAAGSNHLRRREIDGRTVQRCARVAVDSIEQARLECGDLQAAAAESFFHWSTAIELADVLAGRLPGRRSPEDITLFESQGISVWDVAVAARVYALARERGLGREIPLFAD